MKGVSQEALAEGTGIDRSYIGGIERGERNPALKTIVALADALGVSPARLFHGIGAGDLPHHLEATRNQHGLSLRFRYDQYNASYDLPIATMSEFRAVIETLRSGLRSMHSRSDAVADTFLRAAALWPHANPSDLWTFVVNRAYCDRDNHPPSEARLNLEQSWKRTSGWALERVLVRHYGPFLARKGISLQLGNRHTSTRWFKTIGDVRLIADKADVLIVRTRGDSESFEGVIHVKASIAERRTDDVPTSLALLGSGLMSILWTMDVKSTPSASPVNHGEFGEARNDTEASEKRKDIEQNGHFSACFSYNSMTNPTEETSHVRSRIYTCGFGNPDDEFSNFIINNIPKVTR